MQLNTTGKILLPSQPTNSIKRPSLLLNGFCQYLGHLLAWLQLDTDSALHAADVITSYILANICKLVNLYTLVTKGGSALGGSADLKQLPFACNFSPPTRGWGVRCEEVL